MNSLCPFSKLSNSMYRAEDSDAGRNMQETDRAIECLPDSFHPEMQTAMNAITMVDCAKWQH